jgi:cytochrome c oxidase cbb3-type subunit 2
MYDHPFQWGSKRTGPDLARVGAKYSDEWHVTHLVDPRAIVPASVMPGYPFLADTDLDYHDIAAHLKANRTIGVPYSDAQVEHSAADLRAQANPDDANTDDFLKRYPKANVRDFDGKPGRLTEMDALVAYLQMLGTLVDFKLYDDKADLR